MMGLGGACAQDTLDVSQETLELPTSSTLSIVAVGDVMLGTNYPDASYLPPENGKWVLSDVEEILVNADLTFGNLEGVLMGAEGTVAKRCSDPAKCYASKALMNTSGTSWMLGLTCSVSPTTTPTTLASKANKTP